MTDHVTVSGPGIDRRLDAAVGLSAAITYASAAAGRREEATYYVRTETGDVVGRADSTEDGRVAVLRTEER